MSKRIEAELAPPARSPSFLSAELRVAAFCLYVCAVPTIPFAILGGAYGAVIAVTLTTLLLVWTRARGSKSLLKASHAKPCHPVEYPGLHAGVNEQCRRLGIQKPKIHLIASPSVNAAAFGFSRDTNQLLITTGTLDYLSPPQVSALVGRVVVQFTAPSTKCLTWLACFLLYLEGVNEGRGEQITRHSLRDLVLRMLLVPATILPIWLLTPGRETQARQDEAAVQLTRSPRVLAEALRILDVVSVRIPLQIPFALAHLFVKPPAAQDPIAQVLLERSSLSARILRLETAHHLQGSPSP